MGTSRSAVCAASVAVLLLVFAAPAAAVVSGPVMEAAERSERLLEDVEEIVDDVLEPVVRDGATDVSPATDTPITTAPAHAQAVAASPGGMRWHTALGGAALILLLVSTALLAEIRPRGSGAS